MATKLYFRTTTANLAGYSDLLLTAGAGLTTGVVNSTASGTDIQWTATAGGSVLAWITKPFAAGFTLTTTDIALWVNENGTGVNAGGRYRLYKYSGGVEGSAIDAAGYDDGVEFTKTTPTLMTWIGNNADTAFSAGDRLVVKLFITNVGTMGAGNCTLDYNAGTGGADGDSFINLNENVTFSSPSSSVSSSASSSVSSSVSPSTSVSSSPSTSVSSSVSSSVSPSTSVSSSVSASPSPGTPVLTTFMEPGGDADFTVAVGGGFWSTSTVGAAVATDFVHGGHIKSIKYRPANADVAITTVALRDAGSRASFYIYLAALPTATATIASTLATSTNQIAIKVTSAGVLQLWRGNTAQVGSNGATLSTGTWYRISLAFTIATTTVNEVRLFVDGSSSVSVSNITLSATGATRLRIGNIENDSTLDFRSSDHYIDDGSQLNDTGDIWVTAKRPNANGTTNNFNTQIGSGGSGYGTGHSPQVNERPANAANGWSVVAVAATTEEYNVESASTGDISLTGKVIIDYLGWVKATSLTNETASIRVNNVDSSIALTSTITMFTKVAGSATYPPGSGHDIGIITDATATTVSLYEAGILVAYRSAVSSASSSPSSSVSPSTSVSSSPSTSVSSSASSSPSSSVSPSTSVSSSPSPGPNVFENYKSFKAGDGISVGERIK